MDITPKNIAIKDIKDALIAEDKCFISFIEKLDPIMDKLVKEQIKKQLNK